MNLTRTFLTLLAGRDQIHCERCGVAIRLGDSWTLDIHHESTLPKPSTICSGCAAEAILWFERVSVER